MRIEEFAPEKKWWGKRKETDQRGRCRSKTSRRAGLQPRHHGVFRDRSSRFMNRAAAERLNCTFLKPGDILIARMPEPLGRACVFPGDGRLCATVVDVAILRVNPGILLPEYIALTINSPLVRRNIGELAAGTTRQRVSRGNLALILVPVPPLAEQKRIVAKVDQLMAQCDDLEARQAKKRETSTRLTKSALEALTTVEGPEEFDAAWKRVVDNFHVLIDRSDKVADLRRAILELAVRGTIERQRDEDEPAEALLVRVEAERRRSGGRVPTPGTVEPDEAPFELPASWRWVRWGQLVLAADAGWSPQCENHPRSDGHWGVVKVSAVSWDRFLAEENKELPAGVDPRPECAIRSGDFLMSRANTAELVGRSVVVDDAPARLMMSDKIVRCAFSGLIEPRFVNLYNKTAAARAHYVARASGTSDSMKNISREVIFSMPVALPPVEEQRRILAKVERLLGMCDRLEGLLLRSEDGASHLATAAAHDLVA
jgi:type I restriction enzyme S subunit